MWELGALGEQVVNLCWPRRGRGEPPARAGYPAPMSPGLLELEEGEASCQVGCAVCRPPSGGSLSLWHRRRSNGEAGLPRPEYPTPASPQRP